MERIVKFLKDNPTYFLATMNGDQPEVRPFGTASLIDGKIYIETGRIKDVYKQMKANPKIAICGWDGQGTWLRVDATAVEDARVEIEAAVLDDYPELKAMYTAGDGNTAVFFLENGKARFCSFGQDDVVVEF